MLAEDEQDRLGAAAGSAAISARMFAPPSFAAATTSSTRRADVDRLQSHRRDRRIVDEALDPQTCCNRELDQPPTLCGCGPITLTCLRRSHEARQPGSEPREPELPTALGPGASCGSCFDLRERPCGRVVQHGIVALHVAPNSRHDLGASRVARGNERVSSQPARIVARDVESIELRDAALRHLARASRGAIPATRVRHLRDEAPARRFSTPRFHGQTSWQMSQP